MSTRTFFPRVGTGKILIGANFMGYLFSSNRWGVVALTPAGEFLVLFSLEEQRAGWRTFYRDREGVQRAVDHLSDLYGEERLDSLASGQKSARPSPRTLRRRDFRRLLDLLAQK